MATPRKGPVVLDITMNIMGAWAVDEFGSVAENEISNLIFVNLHVSLPSCDHVYTSELGSPNPTRDHKTL
jgi:hypothetical protein